MRGHLTTPLMSFWLHQIRNSSLLLVDKKDPIILTSTTYSTVSRSTLSVMFNVCSLMTASNEPSSPVYVTFTVKTTGTSAVEIAVNNLARPRTIPSGIFRIRRKNIHMSVKNKAFAGRLPKPLCIEIGAMRLSFNSFDFKPHFLHPFFKHKAHGFFITGHTRRLNNFFQKL